MLALVLGVTGMARNDQRAVYAAMAVGGIGVVMRFFSRESATRSGNAPPSDP